MFTTQQIEQAHEKVKSGADFPKYIQEIKGFGVQSFITFVKDSHTEYFGADNFTTSSNPKYEDLEIAEITDSEKQASAGAFRWKAICTGCLTK